MDNTSEIAYTIIAMSRYNLNILIDIAMIFISLQIKNRARLKKAIAYNFGEIKAMVMVLICDLMSIMSRNEFENLDEIYDEIQSVERWAIWRKFIIVIDRIMKYFYLKVRYQLR